MNNPGPSRPGFSILGKKEHLRFGILGSGKGSNLRAIAEAWRAGTLGAEPVIVLSDIEGSGILHLGSEFGIPSHFVPPGPFRTKITPEAEREYVRMLRGVEIDFVVLAGFMRVIKEPLLEAFPGKILNIHPSLLPEFKGINAWRQAFDAGVSESGCTVHLVDADLDSGKILGQNRVPVLPGDTADTLYARIQTAEHELYPKIIREFAAELKAG